MTKACLSCHNEAATQIHKTIHWTWKDPADPSGETGKGGLSVNNFCIAVGSNEPRCTSCHIGYGWKDKDFDFSKAETVDCLVCHETTGTYKKFPSKSGYPVTNATMFEGKTEFLPPDYNKVAQSVGRPDRNNCGTCHFYSGEYDFVDTEYVFPITHMVAPKDQAVACVECHAKAGRLDHLGGFYMPGRDSVRLLDMGGWAMVGASVLGVVLHGHTDAGRNLRLEWADT